jgi:hypothetical protein
MATRTTTINGRKTTPDGSTDRAAAVSWIAILSYGVICLILIAMI